MKYQFNEIFKEGEDGSLSPIRRIRVGGVSFGPGASFSAGTVLGGINFSQFRGHELEIEEKEGILIIKGIY